MGRGEWKQKKWKINSLPGFIIFVKKESTFLPPDLRVKWNANGFWDERQEP